MKKIFTSWTIYEKILLSVGLIASVASFIFAPKHNYLALATALLGLVVGLFTSKGIFWAPIVSIVYNSIYVILSLSQKYYGSVIMSLAIVIPMNIVSIITWIKNKGKKEADGVTINKIHYWEYIITILVCCAIGVGFYFILQALHTKQLLLNTFVMAAGMFSTYMVMRRSRLYSIGYILQDICLLVMWSITIAKGGLEYLPTLVGLVVFCFIDNYGVLRWKNGYKKQNVEDEVAEA